MAALKSCSNKLGAPVFQQLWQCHPPLHLCTGTTGGQGMIPACQMFSGLPGRKLFLTPGCSMVFQPAVPHQADRDAQNPFTWDPEDNQPTPTPGCPQGCTASLMCPCNTSLQQKHQFTTKRLLFMSLCLAFPEEHSPALVPHPPPLAKPSQLVQGLFPEQLHKAVWQQLPSY